MVNENKFILCAFYYICLPEKQFYHPILELFLRAHSPTVLELNIFPKFFCHLPYSKEIPVFTFSEYLNFNQLDAYALQD